MIEDNLPEHFRIQAYHPSAFIYAFKKNTLDKLFEELLASNIAILGGEAWFVLEDAVLRVIPLKDGSKDTYFWKIKQQKGEEWYDFVERSTKESLGIINNWAIDKQTRASIRNNIYYHFDLALETK